MKKKTFLMHFEDFMKKLHSIQWEEYDQDTNSIISRKGNWKLSYRINEMEDTLLAKEFPLKVVVHIRFQDKVVQTWGCESNEENGEFLYFFKKRRSEVIERALQDERQLEKLGEEMWNNI